MMRARRRTTLPVAVLTLLAAAAACDVTGSDVDPAGAYLLHTVNGLPLPATVVEVEEPDGTEWSFIVVDGGIELDAGRYLMWLISEAHQDGELEHTGQEIWTGSYTTRRGQVTFVADETGATGTGRADGIELRLTVGTPELGELTLLFLRVD